MEKILPYEVFYLLCCACQQAPCKWKWMPRQFGAKLRELRRQRGMTQVDLARRLGLRQGHITNLETGRRGPTVDIVLRAADLFGVTTDYLLRDGIALEPAEAPGRKGADAPIEHWGSSETE